MKLDDADPPRKHPITLRLKVDELKDGWLPPVCIRCGAPASGYQKLFFSCTVPVNAAAGASEALGSRWADIPFCDTHKAELARVTRWAQTAKLGGASVAVMSMFGGIVWLRVIQADESWMLVPPFAGITIVLSAVFVYIWLLGRPVRAIHMTEGEITLVNVGRHFIEAVEAKRKDEERPMSTTS
jgi:hypothetical protein